MKRDYVNKLRAAAEKLDVEIDFGRRKKHPTVIIHCDGRTEEYPFPGTPSDRRGLKNTVAKFRKRVRDLRNR